jgi:hypothetical protein
MLAMIDGAKSNAKETLFILKVTPTPLSGTASRPYNAERDAVRKIP